MTKNQARQILGGITPTQFLAEYWQKKPLLIKNAIPNFTGLLSPEELAGLACEEDVQSRIVEEINGIWHASHGPFDDADFARLPEQPDPSHRWTLLVQSVNHFLPEATQLLQQFNFIPLIEGAPLRILKNFHTTQEWLLEAGDMLYLPPHLAHWGIAVSDGNLDCMTYSIGFRAPKNQELTTEFLGYMQDRLNQDAVNITGMYQDADLRLQEHPAEISQHMIDKVSAILKNIRWSALDVGDFLGTYLSEPKPDVVFDANKKISLSNFNKKLLSHGIALDLKSQMLFINNQFYLNAETAAFTGRSAALLCKLADYRQLNASDLNQEPLEEKLQQQLYAWYLAGFLDFMHKQNE